MVKVKCSRCALLNETGAARCQQCGTMLPRISFEDRPANPPGTPPNGQAGAPQNAFQFRRGQVVNNRYTVLDMIGRGGMGCIYKVHDNVLGEDLALKTLLPQFITEKTVIDRFLNEARITRKLTHPNIVRVHDIGMAGQGIFISMEYVQGDSLRALLERRAPGDRMPVRQVLHIIDQLCVALDYAHQYTVHRDIKPENIMITGDNQIKLMDFGISKLMDNRYVTSVSMVMGTPYYMSPEQQRNTRDVDARADIFSVGVVLYEMLTGNTPAGLSRPASQLSKEMPPALDEIVSKCMDPDRNKRFESAGALRRAILPIIEMLDEGKDPGKTLSRRRFSAREFPFPRLRLFLYGAAAVSIVLAGAFALFALEKINRAGAPPPVSAATGLPAGRAERFSALESLAAMLQPPADDAAKMGGAPGQWASTGRERWRQALEAAQQGKTEAVPMAEDALQHMMAAMMHPEGMVFVPAGEVTVDGITIFEPGFFIDADEVTMGEFDAFCSQVEGGWEPVPELREMLKAYPKHPVAYVSWFDAQAYAAWCGKQLPARSQWERAAHGAPQASSVFPWGEEWKEGAANVQTGYSSPVASFKEDLVWSQCYDMAGNVAEWTGSPAGNVPPGDSPDFGDPLFICGGSFARSRPLNLAEPCYFENRLPDLGFRCVLPVTPTPEAVEALIHRRS